ncbi:MAG: hypothetical protein WC783_03305 [Candidatus Paceibacterota bacterium]|jgi:transposase
METEISRENLEKFYSQENKSIIAIANLFDVSSSVISRKLHIYRIPRRVKGRCKRDGSKLLNTESLNEPDYRFDKYGNRITKEDLHNMYHVEHKSLRTIGQKFGKSRQTILDWMRYWGIPSIRTRVNIPYDTLQQYYYQDRKSIKNIAELYDIPQYKLKTMMTKYGFEHRDRLSPYMLANLNRSPFSKILTKEVLMDCRSKGMSWKKIANKYKASYKTVVRFKNFYGI